ncbi:hypothetical protein GCM10027347_06990 [Larkinella harenae]
MNELTASKSGKAKLAAQVLIVEDNLINQTFLVTLLRKYGITSAVVGNGLEAVNFLKTQTVDLVLMDIQMPVMDGLVATQHIRGQLGLATPVVAVTSNPEYDARPRCRAAGMDDFLSKPIQRKQLEAILDRFLNLNGVEPALIDQSYLQEITSGDKALLIELITFFQKDLPINQSALFKALEEHNRTEFDYVAHRFRSSLNSLAMLEAAANLKKLEKNTLMTDEQIAERLTILFEHIALGLKALNEQIKEA